MFIAVQVSQEVIRSLRPVVEHLRTRDSESADQIVRAASGAARNLAEGSKRLGKDRLHFYSIADGSVREVRTELGNAEAWGHLDGLDLAPALALLDRQAALVYRLLHPRAK
jgi:four helix bundle protein